MSNLRYTLLIYDEDDNSVRHFFENNFDARFERIRKVNHFNDFGMLRAYVSQTEVFRKMISKPQLAVNETSDVLIDVLSESSQRQVRTGNVKISRNLQTKKYHGTMDSGAQMPNQGVFQSTSMNRNDGLSKNKTESRILNEKLVIKLSNDFEKVVHRPPSDVQTTSLEDEEEQEKIRLFKLKILAKEVNFPCPKMTSIKLDNDSREGGRQSSNKVPKKIQDQSYDERRREVMKMIAEKCRNPDVQLPTENGKSTISAGIKENGELEELKRRIALIEKQMVTAKMKGRQNIDPVPEEQEDVQLIEYSQENVVEERDTLAEPCHDDLADDDVFQPDLQLPPETSEWREAENEEMVEMGAQETQKTKLKRGHEPRGEYCLRKTNERDTLKRKGSIDGGKRERLGLKEVTRKNEPKKKKTTDVSNIQIIPRRSQEWANESRKQYSLRKTKERKIYVEEEEEDNDEEEKEKKLLTAVEKKAIKIRREAMRIRKREYWRKLKNDQTEAGKAKYEKIKENLRINSKRHREKQKEKNVWIRD